MENYQWIASLENKVNSMKNIKHLTCGFKVEAKATIEEINNIEQQLGIKLPSDFRKVLLEVSKSIKFYWFREEGLEILKNEHFYDEFAINAPDFNSKIITSGGILDNGLWDINGLIEYMKVRESYEFFDEDFPRAYWGNSLIFAGCGNGDYFAIDLKYNFGEVIYLSSNYDMHGLRLGKNFTSFFSKWIDIGCAGHWGQDFYLFLNKDEPYIASNSKNALLIREWLGFDK